MNYKKTLLMPKTDFAMKANLPNKEPNIQKDWEEKAMYEKVMERTKDRPLFVLHDGPPYANGDLHLGHALNKTLKDFIVRYKSMTGYHAPYVPGWDTHGLPIEAALTKNKKVDRKKMSVAEFRAKCEEYALGQVDRQREQFKRLGGLADWDHPYITLHKDYEAEQIKLFGEMAKKGYIYKDMKAIYWSPSSESALAEAEIEYHDKRSASIYVALKVEDGRGVLASDVEFVIWTTTPWTMPANLGIAVHPDLSYVVVKEGNRKFLVAEALLDNLKETLEWEDAEIVQTIKGRELEHILARHPFYERTSLVMLGDHVTTDAGTGCVHTAPGHGEDDFILGKRYGLDILSPVDERGHFTNDAPGFEGQYYDAANKGISELLEEKGALLKLSFFTHSYPHDWRTKKPIIFRATPQWFASIKDFRDEMIQAIKKVNWYPSWGETRLHNMVRDREDWCISRQRAWGVPIPVFYGENQEPIITEETIQHVAELFRQHGSNIWFEWETKDLLPAGFASEHSPNGTFTREKDIMDVWFDSGSSHQGVLQQREELRRPADVYLEGSDQYRGWFNSSLSTAVAVTGEAPYKSVISHGFTLDGEGRKMSKSLGNTISPDDVSKRLGADILRLWVASSDYQADVRVSDEILKQVAEAYRKIRNTIRFLLGNLADFNPEQDRIDLNELKSVDRYIHSKRQKLIETVKAAYDRYDFSSVYQAIHHFCSIELSAFYMDFAKDVLYIEGANHPRRRAIQTVMHDSVIDIVKLLAPIIPHTMDEAWSHMSFVKEESVHLSDMPEALLNEVNEDDLAYWDQFMNLRNDVLKALENARNEKVIGKSLQAQVDIAPKTKEARAILEAADDLEQLFIVSGVTLLPALEGNGVHSCELVDVRVTAKEGKRCERCWTVTDAIGSHATYPDLCSRCAAVVETLDIDIED
ncbi:isoleucine--tRNA ligase [Aureibacillus halotolerans]|uniref:Isoleucine--tRNA ligase n=1 Tax=Aureibacillus halotolerans TaxID=1508390 RepID=A0A4R6UC64_9BACI|nr:isoleucine--tRNA ligase [Aureibacillus halotolerans]TDQ42345.1 isoleucyl-tRNA synthetase [Aureibacillus halotolerans]